MTSAYFAVIVTGPLLLATGALALGHVRAAARERRRGGPLAPALPLVGLGDVAEDVDPAWLSTRIYVGVVFVLFALVPTISLVHLARVVPDHGVVWSEAPQGGPVRAACVLGLPWPLAKPCAASEIGPAAAMLAGDGRLRLAETRCDVESARAGGARPASGCAGAKDRSSTCETTPRKCWGVDWLRGGSPALLLAATGSGVVGFVLSCVALAIGAGRSLPPALLLAAAAVGWGDRAAAQVSVVSVPIRVLIETHCAELDAAV